MTVDQWVERLDGKPRGNGWKAKCPAHEDRTASLGISEGADGRVLLNCFAGCTTESIVAAVGLSMSDLFPDESRSKPKVKPAEKKKATTAKPATFDWSKCVAAFTEQHVLGIADWRRVSPVFLRELKADAKIGLHDGCVAFPVVLNGKVVACHYRLKDTGKKKNDWLHYPTGFGSAPMVFGELGNEPEIFESTWDALYRMDKSGKRTGIVCARGISNAKKVAALLTEEMRPYHWPQNDEPNAKFEAELVALAPCPIKRIPIPKDKKDLNDWGVDAAQQADAIANAREILKPEKTTESDAANAQPAPEKPKKEKGKKKAKKESAASRLVAFVTDQRGQDASGDKKFGPFSLFHDPHRRAFARYQAEDHVEIWSIKSAAFRELLAQLYHDTTGNIINRNALADAVTTLVGLAVYRNPEKETFLRVAPYGSDVLIDLCDPMWRVVLVTAEGWQVLETSPVAFVRTGSMLPLPEPRPGGGSIKPLWELLNVTKAQRPLVTGAILNAYHPFGPYFVTDYLGEHGTAKSTAARFHRQLIDPSQNPLRSPPREESDLLVQAVNNWCVALDNLSYLPLWLSDALCRIATGGGLSKRSLYTDTDEVSLEVKRPVILNGIQDVATRPDLADRVLQIELEEIQKKDRITEKVLRRKFEQACPAIFTAILDAISMALRILPTLKLGPLPRMADAVEWAVAGETAFGFKRGTFLKAYQRNLDESAEVAVEASLVGAAIRDLLEAWEEWAGTPRQLLDVLNETVSDKIQKQDDWPENPQKLGLILRRIAPALRRAGIGYERQKSGDRIIRLTKAPEKPAKSAAGNNDDANSPNLHVVS